MQRKKAIIIGAGPAGLTAAYELLKTTDIQPIIFEMSQDIGGISKTAVYKGNRIDIGGHRFFSKSSRVMNWWLNIMPLQEQPAIDDLLLNRSLPLASTKTGADPEKKDLVMLLRSRLSRIFFLRRFFDYPITLTWTTFRNLGAIRIVKIGCTYLWARFFPIKNEQSLEDFLINRFGRELYETFFRDYTEKVWGVPCHQIPADWGAQRIKGLSITKTIKHALKKNLVKDRSLDQKGTETSLIEQFLYPKLGPGQLWEEVARQVVAMGGEIHMDHQVVGMRVDGKNVQTATVLDGERGVTREYEADFFISTMPIKDLVASMDCDHLPDEVKKLADGLMYRDFITVGLLLNRIQLKNNTNYLSLNNIVPDNWIYIQEKEVKLGRLQIFNNWSPYMVQDKDTIWIGLEYFCNKGDELWEMEDADFIRFAIDELVRIDIIEKDNVLDATLLRVEKTYPAYFGTYDRFDRIRHFTDSIDNLFLVGRNGMHRYNNADHSMLTAMTAVENIKKGVPGKDNIWAINTEDAYHEEKEGK
ncbi:NAD(P)/FAD-dependent oxidoreductase [Desulfobulbus alkaliphilus]|uniref:NAD(P)/FAD-dependent oxidoreductase n=1 Tax=Desulfobulbus alkaliphilus TaxID=869814 RepID=UPI0019638E1B|nr:NAD(P)/FAD-dependent oxidoreductase [Desulfobulbus alkaliphilus]MBM9538212.1 NAD(P)/FAD-dependent oxidoreductase [Desulfobulbus alkaliphilus]